MEAVFDPGFDPVINRNRKALDSSKYRRPFSHRLRVAAKQHAEEHTGSGDICQELGIPCWQEHKTALYPSTAGVEKRRRPQDVASARRSHIEKDLKYHHALFDSIKLNNTRPIRNRNVWAGAEDEGLELARSSVPLPSDRLQRHPSLGREDAFCDATTFKGRGTVTVRRLPTVELDEDAQIAELYKMGLLYDDNEKSTADLGLTLNNITHEEPVYSIRPAKRTKKLHNKTRGFEEPLNLDLSFADLGNDDDLARYLVSPAPTPDTSHGDAEPIQHDSSRHTRKLSAPLRVVYELDHNNSGPSFDVDTSQPPDLIVDDSLSDYDYFTDSDMDEDVPSQREVDDGAAAATASGAWVLLGDDS